MGSVPAGRRTHCSPGMPKNAPKVGNPVAPPHPADKPANKHAHRHRRFPPLAAQWWAGGPPGPAGPGSDGQTARSPAREHRPPRGWRHTPAAWAWGAGDGLQGGWRRLSCQEVRRHRVVTGRWRTRLCTEVPNSRRPRCVRKLFPTAHISQPQQHTSDGIGLPGLLDGRCPGKEQGMLCLDSLRSLRLAFPVAQSEVGMARAQVGCMHLCHSHCQASPIPHAPATHICFSAFRSSAAADFSAMDFLLSSSRSIRRIMESMAWGCRRDGGWRRAHQHVAQSRGGIHIHTQMLRCRQPQHPHFPT